MRLTIGTKFITTEGYEVEIVDRVKNGINSSHDLITCKFTTVKNRDGNDILITRMASQVLKKIVPNPMKRSNKYNGMGLVMKYRNKTESKIRDKWYSILCRLENDPHYINKVSICDEWMTFENFYNWVINQIGWEVYSLDKDLLQGNKENKVYSPETCVFVPQLINTAINSKEDNSGLPKGIAVLYDKKTIESVVTYSNKDGKSVNLRLGKFKLDSKGLLNGFIHSKIAREMKLQKIAEILYKNELLSRNSYKAITNYRFYSKWIEKSDIDNILSPNDYDKSVDKYLRKYPELSVRINKMMNDLDEVPLNKLSKLVEYKRD